MRGNLTAYERRESIKTLLVKERFTTAVRLAYLYEVDKQTIRRDIAFLSNCMPITTKSGNGGGIFLEMDFEKPKEYLSTEEETLLIRLSETFSRRDKLIMLCIINKFSVPKNKSKSDLFFGNRIDYCLHTAYGGVSQSDISKHACD